MNDIRFARKAQVAASLPSDFQSPRILSLLRCMFGNPSDGDTQALDAGGVAWEGPDYAPKEFAAFMGRPVWAVYKWLDPDGVTHFPVHHFFDFVAFVAQKSGGTDHRLAHYIADVSGYAGQVREIERIIKGGKA